VATTLLALLGLGLPVRASAEKLAAAPGAESYEHLTGGGEKTLKADFYVAPNGNDQWSGKLARPNAAGHDGPFATIARARDAVRLLKKSPPKRDILVLIRAGIYRLDETLVFSLEDLAPSGGTITYAAYPGETPVLSSGTPVRNWKRLEQEPDNLPPAARGLGFQRIDIPSIGLLPNHPYHGRIETKVRGFE
jgi:hypothetical protein